MTRGLLVLTVCACSVASLAGAVGLRGQTAPMCGTLPVTIVGTSGDDVLTGTPRHDVIAGLGGNDTIAGGGGGDTVCGHGGNDTISTQDRPESALTVVYGGSGNDTITMTGSWQVIRRAAGGPGDDRIDCGSRARSIVSFLSASGPLVVNLAVGTATGDGADVLVNCGGARGSRFADELIGSGGNDSLDGDRGDDRIVGAGGNDELYGREGDDTLDGGPGVDGAGYGSDSRKVVNLATGRATGEGTDRLRGIENLNSGIGADVLIGDAKANEFDAYLGNDRLVGGAGRDLLRGGDGRDSVDGGPGRDVCRGEVKRRCP